MTTPAKTTTYTQCEQCGFWHAPAEPHCANCGVSFREEYETEYHYVNRFGYSDKTFDIVFSLLFFAYMIFSFILGMSGGAYLDYLFGFKEDFDDIGEAGFFTIVCSLVFPGIPFIFHNITESIADNIREKKIARQVLKQSTEIVAKGLHYNEKLIKVRLGEIGRKEGKIYEMAQELKKQGESLRNTVRFETLKKGLSELSRQRDRYTEKLREIELIRWGNQLSPLLSHSPNLTEQQTTERLETLGKIRTQGQQLAQAWKQTPLVDEETRCAARLNQALNNCDQLRQDLLDLKTALAVGDISAFSKEEQRASQTALELLDTFNALPDVGGFTAGFKKLEDEYFRLQSEDEVRQMTK